MLSIKSDITNEKETKWLCHIRGLKVRERTAISLSRKLNQVFQLMNGHFDVIFCDSVDAIIYQAGIIPVVQQN